MFADLPRRVAAKVASYSPAGATPRDRSRGFVAFATRQPKAPGQMLAVTATCEPTGQISERGGS